jgi:hypothetical protein
MDKSASKWRALNAMARFFRNAKGRLGDPVKMSPQYRDAARSQRYIANVNAGNVPGVTGTPSIKGSAFTPDKTEKMSQFELRRLQDMVPKGSKGSSAPRKNIKDKIDPKWDTPENILQGWGRGAMGRGKLRNSLMYGGGGTALVGGTTLAHDAITGDDPTGINPALAERLTELGASGDAKVSKGGNSPSANPERAVQKKRSDRAESAKDALYGLPPGQKAALYALLGLGSGVATSRVYGGLTGRQSLSRDAILGGTGALAGGTIGGASAKEQPDKGEEKTASESTWDGMYHGYKRR